MRAGGFLRLVGFECRKTFFTPWMLVFIAALLIFNGWKIRDSYHRRIGSWSEYQAQYDECYQAYSGIITAEKVEQLMTVYAPLEAKYLDWSISYEYDPNAYIYSEAMDEEFYRTLFVTEMKYDYFYQNEAYRIASNAAQLSRLYESRGNTFEAAKNRRIAEDFRDRRIGEFTDTRGYEVLLEYDYSVMLVLLLCIFALCGVFVTERETDMYMLLRTTRRGSGSTVAAKLTAAVMFAVAMCALFFGQDFLSVYFSSAHNEALACPVYALRALEATPLNMTVGSYFLWAGVMKTVGILGCCCIILLISSLLRQILGVFISAFSVLVCCVAWQEFSGSLWGLRWLNPAELLIPRDLIAADVFINIFSVPVRAVTFVGAGVAAAAAAMICGILYCSRSYHKRVKRRAVRVRV